jgi:hypothetical protein
MRFFFLLLITLSQYSGTRDELDKLITNRRVGAYVGVDPTAPSIHVGHVIPLMALWWMYFEGYGATTLLGGATAQIGDPTGRTTERAALDNVERKSNITQMHKQMQAMWVHVEALGRKYGYEKHRYWRRALLNNNVWLHKTPFHEVMKLMGSGLRMGSLMSRDSYVNLCLPNHPLNLAANWLTPHPSTESRRECRARMACRWPSSATLCCKPGTGGICMRLPEYRYKSVEQTSLATSSPASRESNMSPKPILIRTLEFRQKLPTGSPWDLLSRS